MARTSTRPRKTARKGRTVGVFGPRGSGVSMLVGLVSGATKHPTAITHVGMLGGAIAPAAEVVFIEIKDPEEVELCVINGHIDAANDGVFVKVLPDGFTVDDPTWSDREPTIENIIRLHMVPYHTVMNKFKDPMAACIGLARAAKLKS